MKCWSLGERRNSRQFPDKDEFSNRPEGHGSTGSAKAPVFSFVVARELFVAILERVARLRLLLADTLKAPVQPHGKNRGSIVFFRVVSCFGVAKLVY